MYQRAKKYLNKTYNKFFGKTQNFVFTNENINNANTNVRDLNNNAIKQMEKDMFDKHLDDLCESEISGSELPEKKSSLNNSFIDQQMFNTNKNSKSDCLYCTESYELKNLRRDFGTSTEELNLFSYRSKNSIDQSNPLDNFHFNTFDTFDKDQPPFNTPTLYPPPPPPPQTSNESNLQNSNLYQSINLENSSHLENSSNQMNSTKRKISNSSIHEKIKLPKLNELSVDSSNSEYFDTNNCNESNESDESDESENKELLQNPYL
jgi:hypothetical protein